MRRLAFELLSRGPDELSDAEDLLRQTDAYWWQSYCLERFGTTAERVDQWLTCREHTQLRAHALVADAYARLARKHRHYFKEN